MRISLDVSPAIKAAGAATTSPELPENRTAAASNVLIFIFLHKNFLRVLD
ncbi:MAG: hypothetical protein Q8K05_11235 [Polaromonas sp.]|nr:hypothetical protein [Polaromonas sp.]MDP2256611.1 hypothetical protein [Polaromonas sp.]